jgi:uncharacterized protein
MRLGGQLIDDSALARLFAPYNSLTVGSGLHLLSDPAHPVRYGNHSCDPNLWHADATTVLARRHIRPGEELTIDYATRTGTEIWTMTCQCGSVICRGTVTGRDWRLPLLQRTYGQHWSPQQTVVISDRPERERRICRVFVEGRQCKGCRSARAEEGMK